MLDVDLAELYGVATKVLNQAVKRNLSRFPEEFMFKLTKAEAERIRSSRSQTVTLKQGQNIKYLPYVFTEQGVAMLSSVLNSERAIQVNIAIIKTFVRLREMLSSNAALARKLEELEGKYDHQFKVVFDAIRELMIPPEPPRKKIGFTP
jgi:phage regulator Rha-like protein